ncbi:hypothetical protein CH63R_09954 [Colletotrichum higginsianum IMI 349063]|uniref:Uncharacterized protein n=1 Tax=Colletotrichum higginsianum (strain IMI 349063) TaxID=759273 RepID=A0A1B7Y1E7_COLHI|nr:uncharacterized protein CH63R_09954 [Colletotrichum higginsianum IMI 349063]OBR05834.1 hypothetical protein CH63R_09954 [Colletotrichum higginsianum IMI 349063]GJD03886.1 hypothetical protein ColKHC_12711 [Colletotrichum higginsianum]
MKTIDVPNAELGVQDRYGVVIRPDGTRSGDVVQVRKDGTDEVDSLSHGVQFLVVALGEEAQMDLGHLPQVRRLELHCAVDVAQVKLHEAALGLVLVSPGHPGEEAVVIAQAEWHSVPGVLVRHEDAQRIVPSQVVRVHVSTKDLCESSEAVDDRVAEGHGGVSGQMAQPPRVPARG